MNSALVKLFVVPVNSRNPQVKRIYQEKALGQEEEDGDQVCHRSFWPTASHRQFQLHRQPAGMDPTWAMYSLPPTLGRTFPFTKLGKYNIFSFHSKGRC